MAGIAVTNLVESLSRLPNHHHAHLISGLNTELEQLNGELSVLKEFLVDVAEKAEEEEGAMITVRVLERRIKELVYEVEDTVDVYLTEAAEAAKTKKSLRGYPIKKRINSCREWKMKPLLRKIANYRSTFVVSAMRVEELPRMRTLPPIGIDNVVGREDEEQTVISYLMEPTEELGVISILGDDGLGKTTLARKIYVDTSIAYAFPIRIWIYVSYIFNLDDMLRNILRVFTSQDIDDLSHEELTENVLACLGTRKFLLVLDDMRNPDHWEAIQNVLPKSNGMSKVLITSHVMSSIGANIKLRLLDEQESWKLLQLKVFENLGCWSADLEGVVRTTAHKCDGLPLKIMLVGGILVGQLMKSRILGPTKEVLMVCENVNSVLDYGASPFSLVALAYRRLPDDLRECFLYMGVFPKDYEISAWTLTRLWIAEGLVRGQDLEGAAAQNLDDLISMNLVMVDKTNSIGKVKTCRVHDIIRVFCIYEAEEQNFFSGIDWCLDLIVGEPPVYHQHIYSRRLCVYPNANTSSFSELQKSSWVRSILCFNESSTGLDPSYMSPIFDAFNLLKVLDSKSIRFHKMPPQITKLFHLRYITLSVDGLNILPESLSELWNLQTLVVDTKSRVITVKPNIWRLIWLRHLKTNAATVLSSNRPGLADAGENLQTLTTLSPESCTTDVLERARNLKTLGIRGDLEILFGKMFLHRLDHLEKLKLIHDLLPPNISSEKHPPPPCHLPQPICFPPNLKQLTLSGTRLLWDRDMPVLANIKTLEVLKLKDDAFTGVIWRAGDCFPSLNFFLIENADLVLWKPSTDHLPSLRCLVLKSCENLREIPVSAAENLERLEIERLGKSAVDSAKRIAVLKQQQRENAKYPFKLCIGPGC